jgi:hypothetical protein
LPPAYRPPQVLVRITNIIKFTINIIAIAGAARITEGTTLRGYIDRATAFLKDVPIPAADIWSATRDVIINARPIFIITAAETPPRLRFATTKGW